ncbi:MAG TPA: transposase family protein [Streptosporangiaceae bacterium]
MAGLLAERRREIGTRAGTRALSCWRQAVFALAWCRDRPDVARLGEGFGISQATAYRYLAEAIEVLAARAPPLRQALERATGQGLAYLILDGKLVASDRCKEKTPAARARPSTPGTPARRTGTAATSRPCPPLPASRCGPPRSRRAAPTTSPPPASTRCPACAPT